MTIKQTMKTAGCSAAAASSKTNSSMVGAMRRGAILLCAVALSLSSAAMASCANSLASEAAALQEKAASPVITVSTASQKTLASGGSLDFGAISVGVDRDLTLTIANTGKSDLAIDTTGIAVTPASSTAAGVFSVRTNPAGTVPASGSTSIQLRFTPDSAGTKAATVTIPTNDVQTPSFSIAVTGNGWSVSLATNAIGSITWTTAAGGGSITDDGGISITERGICWSTSQNPTVADSKYVDAGAGTGSYTGALTGLKPGTYYYCRAYASNGASTGYGPSVGFTTTAATPPTTVAPSAINATTAIAGGTAVADSGVTISARGVCWNTTGTPTIADAHTADGSGAGTFSSSLTGLAVATTYYVRAYATNQGNTVYGSETSLKTAGYTDSNGYYVFYDAGSVQTDATYGNWRYMVAAPSDMGTSKWSEVYVNTPQATAIGEGKSNTATIVAALGTNSVSARACTTASFGGYADWFLPSKDELNLMIVNLALNSLGGFNSNLTYWYWSSSEVAGNSNSIHAQYSNATVGYKLKVDHTIGLTRAARRVTTLP